MWCWCVGPIDDAAVGGRLTARVALASPHCVIGGVKFKLEVGRLGVHTYCTADPCDGRPIELNRLALILKYCLQKYLFTRKGGLLTS